MSSFIRVPLAAAVAALTLTGCNMAGKCDCKDTASVSEKTTKASAKGGSTTTAKKTTTVTTTKVVKTTTTKVRHPVRRERVEREYGYAGGYKGGYSSGGYSGGRYAGSSVSVSETETSSSSYRASSSEERYGSRGGGYAYGSSSSSSGGYAYGAGSASGGGYAQTGGPLYAPPQPHHPGYNLASTTPQGYLTWPGKVE